MPYLTQHSSMASGGVRARAPITPMILIAEDSTDNREMLRTLLRLKGYDVVVAENGVEAIEVARTHSPDLIFLDLELPRLNGLNVARNIRRIEDLRGVPIYVLSGHDPATHRQPAVDAGCSDYLTKPLDFARLDTILETLVPLN